MIGVTNESSLHRQLKTFYAGEGGKTEIPACGYVCDCVNSSGDIIEIQTGSFAPLLKKLTRLSVENRIKIVHPIIEEKRIALYDACNTLIRLRKSPKKGCKWDIFNALIHAPLLPLLPNLSIELAVVDVIEERAADGKGSWRRGGISIRDKFLRQYKRSISLGCLTDYLQFVPFNQNETFTAAALAGKTHIKLTLARKTIYALQRINVIEQTGKSGRSKLFRILLDI
jgi:hypothetical protein